MAKESKGIDFVLGLAMGVGSGLLAGMVVVAALAYFAPEFIGLAPRAGLEKSAHAIPRLWD